jgi:isohexenylglutaconyl-CoA hydratase
MLQGQRHTAMQMQAFGLVDEVCTEDGLQATLGMALEAHAKAAPEAVVATKRLMAMVFLKELAALRQAAAKAFAAQLRSREASEGLAAFAQKRKPNWAEL